MPMPISGISGHESDAGRQDIGLPLACAATAGKVNDTLVFEQLFLAAFAAMARIRTVSAIRATEPRSTGICATASARSPASTSVGRHMGGVRQMALTSRAQ